MALDPKELVGIVSNAIADGAGRDIMGGAYDWTPKVCRALARTALRRLLCQHERAQLLLCAGPPLSDPRSVACSVCGAVVQLPMESIAVAAVECTP